MSSLEYISDAALSAKARDIKRNALLIYIILAGYSLSARAELAEDPEDLKDPVSVVAPQKPKPESKPKQPVQAPESSRAPVQDSSSGTATPQSSEGKSSSKSKPKNSKLGVVKFWSNSLSGFRDKGALSLEENVVVTQEDVRIEADKATIYFEPGTTTNEVREVHAIGSVKFSRNDPETGQKIKAQGREAIFNNGKRNITLKGDPVLYRGDDVVRGKIIYYDLTNGWVKADRVEGVVQPSSKKAGTK